MTLCENVCRHGHTTGSARVLGDNVIWVVDSDGENPATHLACYGITPYSPDSESIAFTSFYRDREIIGIYTVDLTNGAVDALLGDSRLPGNSIRMGTLRLSVSPEGQGNSIAVVSGEGTPLIGLDFAMTRVWLFTRPSRLISVDPIRIPPHNSLSA